MDEVIDGKKVELENLEEQLVHKRRKVERLEAKILQLVVAKGALMKLQEDADILKSRVGHIDGATANLKDRMEDLSEATGKLETSMEEVTERLEFSSQAFELASEVAYDVAVLSEEVGALQHPESSDEEDEAD